MGALNGRPSAAEDGPVTDEGTATLSAAADDGIAEDATPGGAIGNQTSTDTSKAGSEDEVDCETQTSTKAERAHVINIVEHLDWEEQETKKCVVPIVR